MEQGRPFFPEPQRIGGRDERAVGQLAGPDLHFLSLRHLDQVEARVEADGHRRRSDPAPGGRELARIDGEPARGEKIAEGCRAVEQRLAQRALLLARNAGHDEHAGLLEQLARRRRDARRLGLLEMGGVRERHLRIAFVDAAPRERIEAAGETKLIAAPHPEHVAVLPQEHHRRCRTHHGAAPSLAHRLPIP